jgi:outer membrane lipopolysaccharide assembly protein LptE/RlpB
MNKKDSDYVPYGRIVCYDEIDELYEDLGYYPLKANNMQGNTATELCEKLHRLGVEVMLDFDESCDRSDTLVVTNLSSLESSILMETVSLLGAARADEFTLYGKDTFRLWWD